MADVSSGSSSLSQSDSDSDSDFFLGWEDVSSSSSEAESTTDDSDLPLSVVAQRLRAARAGPAPASARGKRARPRASVGPALQWEEQDSSPFRHGFSGRGGAMDPRLSSSSTCREIFELFVDDELYDLLLTETNRYARQRPISQSAHMRAWTSVTLREMQAFLALCIMTGIVTVPSLHAYWSTDPLMRTYLFSSVMPRDRFLAILQALHFHNNEDMAKDCPDRLFKLRPVIDHLLLKFDTIYTPDRDISVDDSLFKFYGRLHFKTYNPRKRARFGIKAYKLCQSTGDAAGYCSKFRIYTGEDRGPLPASTAIVLDLVSGLQGKGYNLALDRAFSSPDLFRRLHEAKFNVVGTVMPCRRDMPKSLRTVRLKAGEVAHRSAAIGQNGSLLALVWKDKKDIRLLSTMHTSEVRPSGKRDRAGNDKVKPACVLAYNRLMGGVDRSDQLAANHRSARKSIKWYKKLFFYLVDLTLVNCHTLSLALGHRGSFLDFRRELSRELLYDEPLPQYGPRRQLPAAPAEQAAPHFPKSFDRTSYGDYRYRHCVHCSAQGRRKKTHFECDTCRQPLCVDPCFREYHAP